MKITNITNIPTQIQHQSIQVNTHKKYTPVVSNADYVSFKGLMKDEDKAQLKMCVYDLDDTLLEGNQKIRDKVIKFSSENDKILIYSSARPLKKVQPLIDDGTLKMPDYYVGNNGINIYKNKNGNLEEIKSWSDNLAKNFNKDEIKKFMLDIAKDNMFDEFKGNEKLILEKQRKFNGSKISEYEVYGSPLNAYYMMAPGVFDKTKPIIEQKLKEKNIEADVIFQNFDKNNLQNLEKYFPPQLANDMRNIATPRLNDDGSIDVAIIAAKSDKGKATEYLRKEHGFSTKEVFAAGDAENDYPNANKGYFFGLVSNASDSFKSLIKNCSNIIKASLPGAEGIYEIIEP